MAQKRLKKELTTIQMHPEDYFKVAASEEDIHNWSAVIFGPDDTVYACGRFNLEITLPKDYPFKPPKIRFMTKIYHPNVSDWGAISIQILSSQWSPALTISSVLKTIIEMIRNPDPKNPMRPQIAQQYLQSRQQFNKTAQEWTSQYAK